MATGLMAQARGVRIVKISVRSQSAIPLTQPRISHFALVMFYVERSTGSLQVRDTRYFTSLNRQDVKVVADRHYRYTMATKVQMTTTSNMTIPVIVFA